MDYKILIIGGSAGSFPIVADLLSKLPVNFRLPIILALHRLRHIREGFVEALSLKSTIPVTEPLDKDLIKPGNVYLAPSNYHLLIELSRTFALSTEPTVNHSRPSIDLTFSSGAFAYKKNAIGLILSGANSDGAIGISDIKKYGGLTIVQKPEEAQVKTMPQAAINLTKPDYIFSVTEIINFINSLI